ncbi:S41 family peptidase [Chitinophaga sp.]|uniref:S41 family peptidase n=1 Tax=Chitinophaga sp. TaxID=1869181 RepID=UPI0031E06924
MRRTRIAIFSLLIVAAASACKKSSKQDPGPSGPPADGTRTQLSLDSLYLYAKETYLWYDVLPDYNTFNPRSFEGSDEYASLQSELFKISQYKINTVTGKPYEYTGGSAPKYSFVEKGNAARGIQGVVDLEGKGNDLGLGTFLVSERSGGPAKWLYVRLVERGSPADKAGITRGCEITKINGAPVVLTNAAVTAALNSSTLSLEFRKPGTTTSVAATLTKTAYTNDPVYTWKVFTNGSKITGYINLGRFSRLTVAKASLQNAFSEFATKGVNNLVIDLRYNGGGYVETFQYLANLIAPASLTDKVMYKEIFNKLLQEGNAPILKAIPLLDENGQQKKDNSGNPLTYANVDFTPARNTFKFKKEGSLGAITNVVFIVTGASASASELTINSLKPHMNVKIMGDTTYGKPVGFFGIGIDKYTVYMSQFTSVNSEDKGEYYAGFAPDYITFDDFTRDFGDPEETSLSKALSYINTGIVTGRDQLLLSNARTVAPVENLQMQAAGAEGFTGLVEDRRVLK